MRRCNVRARGRRAALLAALLAVTLTAAPRGAGAADLAAADMALLPPDVDVYAHVAGAAELRAALRGRPALDWIGGRLAEAHLPALWLGLAARAQREPVALFDEVLGRSVTFARRGDDAWVIVATTEPAAAARFLAILKPRLRGPRSGLAVGEVPELDVLVARDGGRILIGPAAAPALFEAALDRTGGAPGATLSGEEAAAAARGLGPGSIAAIIRHQAPLGGWSAIAARLDGATVHLRHAGRFAQPPVARPVTRIGGDFAAVGRLESSALLVLAEPTDIGEGSVELFLHDVLGEPLWPAGLREGIDDVRIVTVGEREGRRLETPVDLLSTTGALCVKMRPGTAAIDQLDRRMTEAAARVRDMAGLPVDAELDAALAADPSRPRRIDVAAAADWLTGGTPILRNVSLNWTTVGGATGSWYVIATDPGHLRDVCGALEDARGAPGAAPLQGRFDLVGSGDGRRIGRHLRSWSERADLFVPEAETAAFRDSMELLAGFADAVERARWRVARPTAREARADAEIVLSGAASQEAQDGDSAEPESPSCKHQRDK